MNIVLPLGSSRNLIATIAIGQEYFSPWEKYAQPSWVEYCRRNDLGLVVFDQELISSDQKEWKKPTWQKLLIGEILRKADIDANNVCYLDSDILINPTSPNIFDSYKPSTIGLTSVRKNLPFPLNEVLRRMAFLRHTCYDVKYPLDSALFMSLEQLYSYHGLTAQSDEACMGLIVFNLDHHNALMRNWFNKYDRVVQSVTNGGDQTHINHEIQNWGNISWLDYRFQAIWPYEMAWKYPFLYDYGREDEALIRKCIEASLYQNYFLHFAGGWHESAMWKLGGVFESGVAKNMLNEFTAYCEMPVTGNPIGLVKP